MRQERGKKKNHSNGKKTQYFFYVKYLTVFMYLNLKQLFKNHMITTQLKTDKTAHSLQGCKCDLERVMNQNSHLMYNNKYCILFHKLVNFVNVKS